MTSREHARPVWVDLATIFERTNGRAKGIDLDQPARVSTAKLWSSLVAK